MTGAVRHAENAVKARRELAAVKATASALVRDLVALVKGMYIFGSLERMHYNGRPVGDVVADLVAAESAEAMLAALQPVAGDWSNEGVPGSGKGCG